jgi:cytosine/adenosine deaminase-related metal-dependent hydrolase
VLILARWVLPVAAPPIEAGAVRVEGGRLAAVGPRAGPGRDGLAPQPGERVIDLGDAALLPGLVDAHAHLEWTALRACLDGHPLHAWPRLFPRVRAAWQAEDYLVSARLGALETLEAGVTCVAESGPTGAGLAAMAEAGLRGRVSPEVLGPDPEEWETLADAAERRVARLDAERPGTRVDLGLAPHGLHTVSLPLLRWCRRFADARGLPLSLHLAESVEEGRFLEAGEGPWADVYARAGIEAAWPGRGPVAAALEAGLLARGTILAHCVHVTADEVTRIAASGAGIACCPQSNGALGVGVPPLDLFLASGVPVGFGTDSSASVGAKDLFAEARAARLLVRTARRDAAAPAGGPRRLIEAMTLGGARLLGLDAEVGSIEPGKRADLAAVALDRPHLVPADGIEAVLLSGATRRDVSWVMVDGEVRVEGGTARLPRRGALLALADRLGARTRAALAPA